MSPAQLTAYHEGGHALVALKTQGASPIHKATIVPRGHALGMVTQVPRKDEYSVTQEQMLASIDVCMGGKVAEELIFGSNKACPPPSVWLLDMSAHVLSIPLPPCYGGV